MKNIMYATKALTFLSLGKFFSAKLDVCITKDEKQYF